MVRAVLFLGPRPNLEGETMKDMTKMVLIALVAILVASNIGAVKNLTGTGA